MLAPCVAVLGLAAALQTAIFVVSDSIVLLADLIDNFGDALIAVPLGIAFAFRSALGERIAGLAVGSGSPRSPSRITGEM